MRFLLTLTLFLSAVLYVNGELPVYAPCAERGYIVDGDYCVFPNGEKCLHKEFNSNVCGTTFYSLNYCIEEGFQTWGGPCCEGLSPYPQKNKVTCQPEKKTTAIETYKMLKPLIWVVLLIIVLVMFKRRKSKDSPPPQS